MTLSDLMLKNFIRLKQGKIGKLPIRDASDLPPSTPGVCIAQINKYYQITSTVNLAIYIDELNRAGTRPVTFIEANSRPQAHRLESAICNVFERQLVSSGVYELTHHEIEFIQEYLRYVNQRVISIDYDKLHNNICERRRGENAPNWMGGISFKPYCFKFNEEFKEHIRTKFGRKCYLCQNIENGKKLSVHHIDYNKNSICNGKEWAFVPLCNKCHTKTNHNRWHWFSLLINYWAMNNEISLNMPNSCDI